MKALRIIIYMIVLLMISIFATYNILYTLSYEEPQTYSIIANVNFDGELKDISFNNLTESEDRNAFIIINKNKYPVTLEYEKKGEIAEYLSIDKINTMKGNKERQTYVNINIDNIEELSGQVLTGNITIYLKKQLFWFLY